MTAAHVDTGVRDSVMTSELGYPRYPTIIHALAQAAELNPAAPGLMCQERLLSYREYAHAVAALAGVFADLGVARERVAVMMPNSMEAAVALLPGLVFSQSVGYTHATNSANVPDAGVKDGDRLLDVPKVTSNTTLTYRYPLAGSLSLMARLNNSYVDSIQDITFARNTLPSYDLVDTRFGVESDRWSAVLFVDNLTNKKALLSDTGALSANVPIFNRVATNQPRTIGADLSYKF